MTPQTYPLWLQIVDTWQYHLVIGWVATDPQTFLPVIVPAYASAVADNAHMISPGTRYTLTTEDPLH